jgi:dTDP-4-amino-4,6-dideoxygalactose transaminase
MKVPFVDLRIQYHNLKEKIDAAIQKVIEETAFIGGKYVTEFEEKFAKKYGVKNCISCANGTDSLYIIYKMLGIGPGDDVITVANSWISTSETITQCGAKPVFVDFEEGYYTIDPGLIEEKITAKTRAIVPVHLYGQVCDIERIKAIADKHGLYLIEDCAQSHFSQYNGKNVGLFGIAASFSFYPGKNLGAYGDAGCIITNDDELALKFKMYARHGSLVKHDHKMDGINSRLDGIHAAVLSLKLDHLDQWTENRIKAANTYREHLKDDPNILLPSERKNARHTYHLFVIRVKKRKELQDWLKENSIETSIHYPTPLPYLKPYEYMNHKPEDFPISWVSKDEILSLPLFPEISEEQIEYVSIKIKEFYTNNTSL